MKTKLLILALAASLCATACGGFKGQPIGAQGVGGCAVAVEAYTPVQITIEGLTASMLVEQDFKEKLLVIDTNAMAAKKACFAAAAVGDAVAQAVAVSRMKAAESEGRALTGGGSK